MYEKNSFQKIIRKSYLSNGWISSFVCAFLPNGIWRIANYDADVLAVQCSQPSVVLTQLRGEDIALFVVSEGVGPDHHLVRLVHFRRTE